MPKKHLKPTVTFDPLVANFDDLVNEMKTLDLPLSQRLHAYISKFNALFFYQEMSGHVMMTFWNDLTLGFEEMKKIRDQAVQNKPDLTLEDLGDALIVYDPPVYCFYTSNPFKYLNKSQLDRKMYYFRKGLEILFHVRPQPTFYPF